MVRLVCLFCCWLVLDQHYFSHYSAISRLAVSHNGAYIRFAQDSRRAGNTRHIHTHYMELNKKPAHHDKRCVVISPGGSVHVIKHTLEEMQNAVGGNIEPLLGMGGRKRGFRGSKYYDLWCNEDGLGLELRPNVVGTFFARALGFRAPRFDFIRGPVVFSCTECGESEEPRRMKDYEIDAVKRYCARSQLTSEDGDYLATLAERMVIVLRTANELENGDKQQNTSSIDVANNSNNSGDNNSNSHGNSNKHQNTPAHIQ